MRLKTEIAAEIIARFIVLLVALPFTVVFLILLALGALSDIFFKSLFAFVDQTKARLVFFENKLNPKQ